LRAPLAGGADETAPRAVAFQHLASDRVRDVAGRMGGGGGVGGAGVAGAGDGAMAEVAHGLEVLALQESRSVANRGCAGSAARSGARSPVGRLPGSARIEVETSGFSKLAALGQTNEGRRLMIVFTIREMLIRVISARDQSREERRVYDQAQTQE
jgi:hypothetical protein